MQATGNLAIRTYPCVRLRVYEHDAELAETDESLNVGAASLGNLIDDTWCAACSFPPARPLRRRALPP